MTRESTDSSSSPQDTERNMGSPAANLLQRVKQGPLHAILIRLRRIDATKLVATIILVSVLSILFAFLPIHRSAALVIGVALGSLVPTMIAKR